MSDPSRNHTTLFHPRFLLYQYYICIPNSSRHTCSTRRRHVPSRKTNRLPIRVREIHHRCVPSWAVHSFSQRGQRKPAPDEEDTVRHLEPNWVRRHVAGLYRGAPQAGVYRSFGEIHTGTLHLALSEAVDVLKVSHAKKFARLLGLPCSKDKPIILMPVTVLSLRAAGEPKSNMVKLC